MAELTAFGFQPGNSLLHRLDPRTKLAGLAGLSIAGLSTQFYGLGLFTLMIAGLMLHLRLSFWAVLKEIRYFFVLLAVMFAARSLSTPGETLFSPGALFAVTREGVLDGTLVCWRLLTIVFAGLLLIASTRPSSIRGALIRLLAPIPFIPEKRVGTMISLLVRFIPVILNQTRETADAQRARGVERRKNPVYRLRVLVVPLLRRIFEDADRLVIAMEARCYSEDRTVPRLCFHRIDGIAALVLASVLAVALMCNLL